MQTQQVQATPLLEVREVTKSYPVFNLHIFDLVNLANLGVSI